LRRGLIGVGLAGVAVLLPWLTACGGSGQVSVSVAYASSDQTGPFKPGDLVRLLVSVVNSGPGDSPGVQVQVVMPPTFQYKSTDEIDDHANARTQPLDARVGASDPQWGFWDIAAKGQVDIKFTALVRGLPDTYSLVARAQGDNTAGSELSKGLAVVVSPAPHLQVLARVDQTQLHRNSTAVYRFTITNTGTDFARGVGLLVTLPPVMVFQQSVTPFQGNSSRNNPVDPVTGSVEVFYGGFLVPAASSVGPGYIVVAFRVEVVTQAQSGSYPVSAQVTDASGDVVTLNNVAPVTVVAPSPSPTLSPRPSPGD
jgi:hypothetical protein